MPPRRTLALDAVVAVAVAAGALGIAAIAHSADDAYPTRWERDKTLEFQFDRKFPEGKFRDRVIDAAKQWNRLDQPLRFQKASGGTDRYPQDQCGTRYQHNVFTKRQLGGNTLGLATWCLFADSSEMYSFQVAFDKNRDWHKGTGAPRKGSWDVLSVATHELGHAAGRSGHFGKGSQQCHPRPVHVMCPEVAPATKDQRQPSTHDKHTFKSAY